MQFSYQKILSPKVLADVRGMARDLSAGLWSNPSSTPVIAEQDRGFREMYLKGTMTASMGAHELKAGADISGGSIREQFGYRITDPESFDEGTLPEFSFDDRRRDREYALFVQDQARYGNWTFYWRLAMGSISPRGRRQRHQPALCGGVVVASGRPGGERFVRPRIPDAGVREPAAREFGRRRGAERRGRATAGAAVTRQLLRSRPIEGVVRAHARGCDASSAVR